LRSAKGIESPEKCFELCCATDNCYGYTWRQDTKDCGLRDYSNVDSKEWIPEETGTHISGVKGGSCNFYGWETSSKTCQLFSSCKDTHHVYAGGEEEQKLTIYKKIRGEMGWFLNGFTTDDTGGTDQYMKENVNGWDQSWMVTNQEVQEVRLPMENALLTGGYKMTKFAFVTPEEASATSMYGMSRRRRQTDSAYYRGQMWQFQNTQVSVYNYQDRRRYSLQTWYPKESTGVQRQWSTGIHWKFAVVELDGTPRLKSFYSGNTKYWTCSANCLYGWQELGRVLPDGTFTDMGTTPVDQTGRHFSRMYFKLWSYYAYSKINVVIADESETANYLVPTTPTATTTLTPGWNHELEGFYNVGTNTYMKYRYNYNWDSDWVLSTEKYNTFTVPSGSANADMYRPGSTNMMWRVAFIPSTSTSLYYSTVPYLELYDNQVRRGFKGGSWMMYTQANSQPLNYNPKDCAVKFTIESVTGGSHKVFAYVKGCSGQYNGDNADVWEKIHYSNYWTESAPEAFPISGDGNDLGAAEDAMQVKIFGYYTETVIRVDLDQNDWGKTSASTAVNKGTPYVNGGCMKIVGTGWCNTNFIAGWDNKFLEETACIDQCLEDPECNAVSYCAPGECVNAANGQSGTCSRFRRGCAASERTNPTNVDYFEKAKFYVKSLNFDEENPTRTHVCA
jgi:hypothetical protein